MSSPAPTLSIAPTRGEKNRLAAEIRRIRQKTRFRPFLTKKTKIMGVLKIYLLPQKCPDMPQNRMAGTLALIGEKFACNLLTLSFVTIFDDFH